MMYKAAEAWNKSLIFMGVWDKIYLEYAFIAGRSFSMIYIDIIRDGAYIILNCHKSSENGAIFQLVIDADTQQIIKRPAEPDIDASIAYSHIYAMMRDGMELPAHTVAAWG